MEMTVAEIERLKTGHDRYSEVRTWSVNRLLLIADGNEIMKPELFDDLVDAARGTAASRDTITAQTVEISHLRSLVDGVTDIVEIWPAITPSQIAWKAEWLDRAREALK